MMPSPRYLIFQASPKSRADRACLRAKWERYCASVTGEVLVRPGAGGLDHGHPAPSARLLAAGNWFLRGVDAAAEVQRRLSSKTDSPLANERRGHRTRIGCRSGCASPRPVLLKSHSHTREVPVSSFWIPNETLSPSVTGKRADHLSFLPCVDHESQPRCTW